MYEQIQHCKEESLHSDGWWWWCINLEAIEQTFIKHINEQ